MPKSGDVAVVNTINKGYSCLSPELQHSALPGWAFISRHDQRTGKKTLSGIKRFANCIYMLLGRSLGCCSCWGAGLHLSSACIKKQARLSKISTQPLLEQLLHQPPQLLAKRIILSLAGWTRHFLVRHDILSANALFLDLFTRCRIQSRATSLAYWILHERLDQIVTKDGLLAISFLGLQWLICLNSAGMHRVDEDLLIGTEA